MRWVNLLQRAVRGRSGLVPWLGLHVAMYGILFAAWLTLVLTIDEGGNVGRAIREIPAFLVHSLGPYAPFVILATGVAVAVAWVFRGLRTIRFRLVAVLLCCAPLVCVISPEALRLLVPLQVGFGLILIKPHWTHPLDADYADSG